MATGFVGALARFMRTSNAMRNAGVRLQSTAIPRPPRPTRTFGGVNFRKSDGNLQLNINHPKFRPQGAMGLIHGLSSEGSIALSVIPVAPSGGAAQAPGDDRVRYEWASAIKLKLSATDVITLVQSQFTISQKYEGMNGKVTTKKLDVVPVAPAAAAAGAGAPGAKAPLPPSYKLTVTEDNRSASVTLAGPELFLLRNLVGLSLPWITGWQQHLDPGCFDPSFHLAAPSGAAAGGAGEGAGAGGHEGGEGEDGGAQQSGGYGGGQGYRAGGAGGYRKPAGAYGGGRRMQ